MNCMHTKLPAYWNRAVLFDRQFRNLTPAGSLELSLRGILVQLGVCEREDRFGRTARSNETSTRTLNPCQDLSLSTADVSRLRVARRRGAARTERERERGSERMEAGRDRAKRSQPSDRSAAQRRRAVAAAPLSRWWKPTKLNTISTGCG